MSVLQQTVRPVTKLSSQNWQRTTFDSGDDDLSLLVSVYLDSVEGSREIVQNVRLFFKPTISQISRESSKLRVRFLSRSK
jgi:hypothetical protein